VPSEKTKTIRIHETVTENTVKPTTETQPDVIEVDSVEPATQGIFSDFNQRFTASWCVLSRLHFIFQFFANFISKVEKLHCIRGSVGSEKLSSHP